MAFFSETIEAKLAGREVATALLTYAEFKDTPRRWWDGFGTVTLDGHDWQGVGEFISIEGLEQPIGTTAPKTTFTLSGVSATIVQLAREASARAKNRRITVYVQFWDVTDWMPLDTTYAIWSGKMDQMRYSAQGPSNRSVKLTAESVWVDRRRPPYGMYTDRDQNSRYPGDKGMELVSRYENHQTRWPVL